MHFALVGRGDCHRVELRLLSSHLNPFPQTHTGGDVHEDSLCQSHARSRQVSAGKALHPPGPGILIGRVTETSPQSPNHVHTSVHTPWCRHTDSSIPGSIVLRLHVTCSKQERSMYPQSIFLPLPQNGNVPKGTSKHSVWILESR